MALSARHHYFQVLLYFCFNRSIHASVEQIASHNFLMNSGTLRMLLRARPPAGWWRRHLVENSSPRAQILKWRNWIGFSGGTFSRSPVFVCAGDIILERDFYISVSPASFTDKSNRLKLRRRSAAVAAKVRRCFPIFARRLLKGGVWCLFLSL